MRDRPQEHEFHVVQDGVYDNVTGETYRRGMDGRLDGSIPMEGDDLSIERVERFEMARRVWDRARAEELHWNRRD